METLRRRRKPKSMVRFFSRPLKQGDSLAKQIVDDYISRLAAGISTFITIFRPQVIILGGGIAHAGDLLLKPLNEKLHTCTFAAEEIGIPKSSVRN